MLTWNLISTALNFPIGHDHVDLHAPAGGAGEGRAVILACHLPDFPIEVLPPEVDEPLAEGRLGVLASPTADAAEFGLHRFAYCSHLT